jgi:hypothetical protein
MAALAAYPQADIAIGIENGMMWEREIVSVFSAPTLVIHFQASPSYMHVTFSRKNIKTTTRQQ